MPPILQRLITLTIRILLRRFLLRQMPFTVRHYLAHMIDVFVRVPRWVLGRVVFEDGDDFAAAVYTYPKFINISLAQAKLTRG